jgi:hypothetical protein
MTKATVRIGQKEYSFEGENLEDTLKSIKYTTVPIRIVRAMGIRWTKKILWPTFSALGKKSTTKSISISLPDTLTSLIESKTDGNLNASVDMNLNTEDFQASAQGEFNSDGLSLSFESNLDEAESTGEAIKDTFNLFSMYNVEVDHIEFSLNPDDYPKSLCINIDAAIPDRIRKKDVFPR